MSHQQISTNFPQEEQLLVRWLEHAIPRFREAVEIPQNLISDLTVEGTCQAIHDDILIRTAEDLGLANKASLHEAASAAPDLDATLSTIEGESAMRGWIVQHRPLLVFQALGKAISKLTPLIIGGKIQNPCRIMRVLLVVAFAPCFPRGGDLLSKFASILNCREPHRMIGKLTHVATKGKGAAINKMDDVILSNACWSGWALWLMERAQSLAPHCWGRLVISRQPVDPTSWNALWDSLLNPKEEVDGN